ncbi:hypothetical protein [Romboutsia sp. 1001285H_161024_C4]|uniref:hypothetical protein n=1 Tax=Romboutsia sp. 1001285H_161024_C4 TaxID=2787109 RepID=UPI00189AD394|nr:hypothetical protein [Romboutsia sp. 1001285H_161024_C4]
MKCKIQVETTSGGYYIYVAYIGDGRVIHRDLIKKYEAYPRPEPAIRDVTRNIFKYKSLGIGVEVDKSRDINNMCNLDKLLEALQF